MSTMLTLIDAGWETVRALAACGQTANAFAHITRLLARPDLPAALVVEGNRLAGELALDLEKYTSARRHLQIAAALEPTHAGTRFALGRSWEDDPDGCDRRAAIYYKKAAALDTANALYRAAFGCAAARCGKVKLGVRAMRAAVQTAASDVEVVRVVVRGLLEVGKVNTARQVLAKARFLCPGNAELAFMWEQTKFESALLSQQKSGKTVRTAKTRSAQDAHLATDGDRVTLPFIRPVRESDFEHEDEGCVRRDTISFSRPHIARLRVRKADC